MRIIVDPKTKAFINLDWMASAKYHPAGSPPASVVEKVRAHGAPERSSLIITFHPSSGLPTMTLYAEAADALNVYLENLLSDPSKGGQ